MQLRTRLVRLATWLAWLAVGFGVAFITGGVTDQLLAEQADGLDALVEILFAIIAFGMIGLVATWHLSRPRPNAGRWLWIGLPLALLVAFAMLGFGMVVLGVMLFPLTWFAAFWAALLPADPAPRPASRG